VLWIGVDPSITDHGAGIRRNSVSQATDYPGLRDSITRTRQKSLPTVTSFSGLGGSVMTSLPRPRLQTNGSTNCSESFWSHTSAVSHVDRIQVSTSKIKTGVEFSITVDYISKFVDTLLNFQWRCRQHHVTLLLC
jgi:hypothetical protein